LRLRIAVSTVGPFPCAELGPYPRSRADLGSLSRTRRRWSTGDDRYSVTILVTCRGRTTSGVRVVVECLCEHRGAADPDELDVGEGR
jgi:hypothetical protein